MAEDFVTDDELLYRRVPNREGNFQLDNGKYRVSSGAFGDRKLQPSVDRANRKNNDPRNSQTEPSDFIVSLIAGDVRHKTIATMPLRQGKQCCVDVTPDPLPDNPAHALIRAVPDLTMDEKTLFKKLKTALARLAQWEIAPQ